jgi:hypothetical protein
MPSQWFNIREGDDVIIEQGGRADKRVRLLIAGDGTTARYRVEGNIVGSEKMGGVDDPDRGVFGVSGGTDIVVVEGPWKVIKTGGTGTPTVTTETLSTGGSASGGTSPAREGVRAADPTTGGGGGGPGLLTLAAVGGALFFLLNQ